MEKRLEKDLVKEFCENLVEITDFLKLPEIKRYEIEKYIHPRFIEGLNPPEKVRKRFGMPRADVILYHSDSEITIIEAKLFKERNLSGCINAVTQVQYYSYLANLYYPQIKINKIVMANHFPGDFYGFIEAYNKDDILLFEFTEKTFKSGRLRHG